jgi:hypothetical protein
VYLLSNTERAENQVQNIVGSRLPREGIERPQSAIKIQQQHLMWNARSRSLCRIIQSLDGLRDQTGDGAGWSACPARLPRRQWRASESPRAVRECPFLLTAEVASTGKVIREADFPPKTEAPETGSATRSNLVQCNENRPSPAPLDQPQFLFVQFSCGTKFGSASIDD